MIQKAYVCKKCNKEFDVNEMNGKFFLDVDDGTSYELLACPKCGSMDLVCIIDEGRDYDTE